MVWPREEEKVMKRKIEVRNYLDVHDIRTLPADDHAQSSGGHKNDLRGFLGHGVHSHPTHEKLEINHTHQNDEEKKRKG